MVADDVANAYQGIPKPYVDESGDGLETLEQRLRAELLDRGAESCCRVVWAQRRGS